MAEIEPISIRSQPVCVDEVMSEAAARRIAAMLDLESAPAAGELLPRGWHFPLLAACTLRSQLRKDGFPGLGVPMPDLGLPRLMLGGRSVAFHADLPIGAAVTRKSAVIGVKQKEGAAGPMATVTLEHQIWTLGQTEACLTETQTYVLLPSAPAAAVRRMPAPAEMPAFDHSTRVTPDDTLLFLYSALGFNSHRIHIDRAYARDVEGFPDLVVNGGLVTLLMTEFLRGDLGVKPARISVRHHAPLFCNRPLTIGGSRIEGGWLLKTYDDQMQLAVTMEVENS